MSQEISVIVIAKDEENLIRKTLESIITQELSARELIVVDGNSTDKTVSIAKEFNARILYSDLNIASARNLGALNATSDILVFIDADTEIPEACLKDVSDFFSNNPFVVGICGKVASRNTPDDNTLFKRFIVAVFYNLTTKISFLIGRPHVTGALMVFRRDNFLKICGFREDLALGEDTDIYRRLSRNGETLYFPKIIAYTSMRRFSKRPLYWLGYWFLNTVVYELCGKTWHKKYPKENR